MGNITFSVLSTAPVTRPGHNAFYKTEELYELVKATRVRVKMEERYYHTHPRQEYFGIYEFITTVRWVVQTKKLQQTREQKYCQQRQGPIQVVIWESQAPQGPTSTLFDQGGSTVVVLVSVASGTGLQGLLDSPSLFGPWRTKHGTPSFFPHKIFVVFSFDTDVLSIRFLTETSHRSDCRKNS